MKKSDKLIAQFMGYEIVTVGYYGTSSETKWQRENGDWIDRHGLTDVGQYAINKERGKWIKADELNYSKSWDLLMPVVGKITPMEKVFRSAWSDTRWSDTSTFLLDADIDVVYNRVVDFITLYNKLILNKQ